MRSIWAQVSGTQLGDATPWAGGTFGEALLAPTTIYVRRLLSLMDKVAVKVRLAAPQAHHGGKRMPPGHHVGLPSSSIQRRTLSACLSSLPGSDCI